MKNNVPNETENNGGNAVSDTGSINAEQLHLENVGY